jgi:hypothetical protein
MQSGYRLGIKLGIFVVFFIIRQIYKSNNKPKEFSISSTLSVNSGLAERLQLVPGEQVSLLNRPDTFEVLVRAKGITSAYEEIGVIEDRELAEKVKTGSARGTIEFVNGDEVKLTLTY